MSAKKKPASKQRERDQPVSLDPIPFEEAVADLLKVKPQKKGKGREKSKPTER